MSGSANPRENTFRPSWWLRNPHAQTIWGRVARRSTSVPLVHETLAASDGDELEMYHVEAARDAPRVFLLHGLEGSVRSHYVGGLFQRARERGWGATLLVHRGCGLRPNRARRFYHSGETSDANAALGHLMERWPGAAWLLIGVSLGGNVLLKLLGEWGSSAPAAIRAAAGVSVPFDLEAGARCIARGFARVYDRNFVATLRRKALAKLARYPDLFDREQLLRARNVYEFDDAVTAPVHGFESARDYYQQSSSMGFLSRIRVPTLLISARDDPFLPAAALDRATRVAAGNSAITLDLHSRGGHVGFVSGAWPWRARYYAEESVFSFFDGVMEAPGRASYD
jgi:predicted alpha/beta-fold hydrolase